MRIRLAPALFILLLLFPALTFAQKSVKSGTVDVNGGKLFYEEAGTGDAVVLIHGGQLDRRMWDDQFQLFAERFRVIRYDVRNYGKSDTATQVYASEEDLYALLKQLDVEKAHLVGLSLGGRIAIDFTLAHPEMVSALVPVGAGMTGFSMPDNFPWEESLDAAQRGDFAKVTELWLKSGFMAPAMENPKLAPRVRQLSMENTKDWMSNPLLERRMKPPAVERLGEIRAPTLIVAGSRDVLNIQAIAGILQARVPGARTVVIPGAGHMVNMEKPEEFNRVVLEFLRGLPKN
ncbi:MAG: alpha/beta hydrolase [Acidobacteria bacterium]|nr:alpha/beta hydrolase [Acidobacteriota bacterium]MBI3663665.1 alpha/beta hydrolase [Acidobacteriota bacterium]